MKFSEIPYNRPDAEQTAARYDALTARVKTAADGKELREIFWEKSRLDDYLQTAATIASIRHTVNTRDAFYDAENDYFDENSPVFQDKQLEFCRALLNSPWLDALREEYGAILIRKIELMVRSAEPELLPLIQQENALASAYQKIYASARIPFDGKELTVSQLSAYKESPDRAVRRAAYEAEGCFFDSHREKLDEIYSKMICNRNEQARRLGFENYVPLSDIRMQRLGYGRREIEAYRRQMKEDVVPLCAKVALLRAERVGIGDPKFYDNPLAFPQGNARPVGTPEEILAAGKRMYRELSPETAQFIDGMFEDELFDVLSRDGKAPGGYCTFLPDYRMPFIFSNFNGTSGDVDVLTHEAGHAFQAWRAAQEENLPGELREAGMESCEIHSMSMEFLTAPYYSYFFGERAGDYALSHLEDALLFLPYGTMVDEFQEIMYQNPDLTPEERNACWLRLEKEYRPWIDFEQLPFYSRGAGWQRQLHIYEVPFYYIDYCLAQTVALQFFTAFLADRDDAWQRYLALVDRAGSCTYEGLIQAAGMKVPFCPGVMGKIAGEITEWIEKMQQNR